jgi:hypothetical protein
VKFVIRPRQGGKTHEAVRWLREDPGRRVIITATQDMAADLRRRYELTASQVTTTDTVRSAGRGRHAEYAVDNLDLILPHLLGTGANPVTVITATGENG